MNIQMLPLLQNLDPREFLRIYWQKKPCLIRQAIPNFSPLLSRESLFSLIQKDEVESRLITCFDNQWEMRHGPHKTLPSIRKKNWTVLVQGMNIHSDEIDQLMRQFRFISDARLDDVMVSYATDTGGVGPHFDSYDVFLLQAHGQRRWRIGAQKNLDLIEGLPLKILSQFSYQEEYLLEPGDMLYLPPHYAHEGVAVGECMTYSIGFRAPSYQELGESFLQFMADSIELPNRYTDPALKPTKHPAKMDTAMLSKITENIQKICFTQTDVALFLGEYLSEPKSQVIFSAPSKTYSLNTFRSKAIQHGLKPSRQSQMLYQGPYFFINGLSFNLNLEDKLPLHHFADQRLLPPQALLHASDNLMESLHVWYGDGWIEFNQ